MKAINLYYIPTHVIYFTNLFRHIFLFRKYEPAKRGIINTLVIHLINSNHVLMTVQVP